MARRRVLSRRPGAAGENPATFDAASYGAWREAQVREQFETNFSAEDVAGRDILDFGCGEGQLSLMCAGFGARSVIGLDLDPERIESARARVRETALESPPRFEVATRADAIDLPDASVDVILCFDVLEHVLEFERVVSEWKRVLRPGGHVFIWWVPWFHPFGHHIESLVPLAWAHVFFSEKTLVATCARIYDLPEFQPRLWDLGPDGKKKPNKWLAMDELPEVNRLTISRFESLCARLGLSVAEREIRGFGSGGVASLTHPLTRLPLLREFFCSHVIYRLESTPV